MIAVHINREGFVKKMDATLAQAKNPGAIMAGVGREAVNRLKAHFRELDKTQVNHLAPERREHFWRQVGNSVHAPVLAPSGRTVTVSITDPRYAQKLFGGTLRAKTTRNLAIPEEPEAYGRRPKVYEQETGHKLFVIKQNSNVLLATAIAGGGLQVEYLLTPSVHQDAEPKAFPDQAQFEKALTDRADAMLERQLKEQGPKP